MRNYLKVSAVALIVGMFAAAPASAISINLGNGNGGLLSVGSTSGSGSAVVNVNTNGTSGTGGVNANVNLGTGGTGNLLDLGGSGGTVADVNLGGTGGTDAKVSLGGGSDSNVLVDLFGTGAGTGNGSQVAVNLGTGGIGTGGLDTGNLGIGTLGTDGLTSDPLSVADAGLLDNLFGAGSAPGGGSGGNGGGTGGGLGGGSGGGLGGGAGGGIGGSGGIQVASLGPSTSCFTPDAEQLNKLAARHVYNTATFSSWAKVTNLKIIDAGLCNSARASVGADANIAQLQTFVSGNAALSSNLAKLGHGPADVIGADRQGNTLILYVI